MDEWNLKPKPKMEDIDETVDKEMLRVRDKIQLMDEVKRNPPLPGEMNQSIKDDIYEIDLDTLLAAQLNDCPATVIPMLIDHGVRTAVDIKNTYKPERRILDFQYWWIIFLIVGLVGVLMVANMFGVLG